MLFLDGAYTFSGQPPAFHRARHPIGEELNRLLGTLSQRIVRALDRRGLLMADPEYPSLDLLPDSSLDHLQAASVAYRIAIGPHAGRKALTLYSAATGRDAKQPTTGPHGGLFPGTRIQGASSERH